MRTAREAVQRLYRQKHAARDLRARLEAGGCADSSEWLHTLKKMTALEASVAALLWVLETDGAPEHVPQVRERSETSVVDLERIDVAPRPPHFPESVTVYLLRVPADDDLGQQPWAAFLSPQQVSELRWALDRLQRTRMGIVVAQDLDTPEGA